MFVDFCLRCPIESRLEAAPTASSWKSRRVEIAARGNRGWKPLLRHRRGNRGARKSRRAEIAAGSRSYGIVVEIAARGNERLEAAPT